MTWPQEIEGLPNMKKDSVLGTVFVYLMLLIPSGNIFGQEVRKPDAVKEYIESLEKPNTLRGDYFKAILAAYELDFAKYISLNEQEIKKRKQNNKDFELFKFLSDLRNYDIYVEIKGQDYQVTFGPTLRNNAPDIFGGGAYYLINGKTFDIKEKRYSK